ncbi:hypothetical protein Leryth_026514 [Lithospermum erythrorhizon]|nr:hypothetical protein Leryth_026514 [Lithospermum erythrorhizon]
MVIMMIQAQLHYSVSYPTKKVRFTLPEFDEYDPTPYGGGYDASEVYGKPLPPSDTVCFPRSEPPSEDVSPEGFSYDSIPCPYGKQDEKPSPIKPQNGETKQGDSIIDVAESSIEDDDSTSDDDDDGIDMHEDGKNKENKNVGIESNIQVLQIPYGSGLEAVDICESIFGYWPCVDKMNRENNKNAGVCNEERYNDQWKSAADYLFGSPFGYGEQKDGGHYAFEYGSNYNYSGEYGR